MSKAIEKAIKDIQKAGFSHIKLELEAQLNRSYAESERYETCDECNGDGFHRTFNALGAEVGDPLDCDACYGEGEVEREEYRDWSSESDCEDFIRNHISQEARSAINYMNFYEDGSVDSELTFTLPVDKVAHALEVIDAWNALAEEIGQGMDVDGAGMHVSVLTSGNYPSDQQLPYENISNFKREVTKLLPALYIAAASGDFTRELQYRHPRISDDDKYSAIFTHNDTCLEYRLFETCYQRPEALYEYLGTIAKTLKYYIDPSQKVAAMGVEFPIYQHEGLDGYTKLPEQVRVIKKQFSLVKPEGYTIKQLMESRGRDLSITKAHLNVKSEREELKKAYKMHKKAIEERRQRYETDQYVQDNIEYWKREVPGNSEDWYITRVMGYSLTLETEEAFISKNIKQRSSAVVSV